MPILRTELMLTSILKNLFPSFNFFTTSSVSITLSNEPPTRISSKVFLVAPSMETLKSLKVLQEGGVILYPTDTIWGLGCDATNKDAVQKIYTIKKREEKLNREVISEYTDFDIVFVERG